jgi:hypothetical protein
MDMSQYNSKPTSELDKLKFKYERLLMYNAMLLKHRKSMFGIFDSIQRGLYDAAHEAWEEIPNDDEIILNLARSSGGIWHPHERSIAVRGVDQATGWSSGMEAVSKEVE